jgi:hypothetical protein
MLVKKVFPRNKAPFRHFPSAFDTGDMNYGACGYFCARLLVDLGIWQIGGSVYMGK